MPDTAPHNESELLLKIAAGDEGAFVILFRKWHPFLATHVFRITESRELAEEVVQDVFLKIWTNRHSLTEVRNFKAFLLTVSRNHAINELNRQIREWRKTQRLNEELLPERFPPAPENALNLQYALLDEAIDQLPPRQKEVYLLNRHERLSYYEITGRLGIGRESVKRNLQLASKAIAHYIRTKLVFLIILLCFYN